MASVGSTNSTPDACLGQNHDPSGETVAAQCKSHQFLVLDIVRCMKGVQLVLARAISCDCIRNICMWSWVPLSRHVTAISVSICGLFVVGRSRLKNVCVDAAARVSPNDSFSRLLEGRAWPEKACLLVAHQILFQTFKVLTQLQLFH